MKLEEIMEHAIDDGNGKFLIGKDLNIIQPFFKDIEEFGNKNIVVLEKYDILSESVSIDENGFSVKQETDPKLTTMDINTFVNIDTDTIRLYSISMVNNQIRLRFSTE